MCTLSCFSHVRLFVTLWTVACQAPLSMGFSRQEYWSGFPCPPPGDPLDPRIERMSLMPPTSAGGFFTTSTTWEAPLIALPFIKYLLSSRLRTKTFPSLISNPYNNPTLCKVGSATCPTLDGSRACVHYWFAWHPLSPQFSKRWKDRTDPRKRCSTVGKSSDLEIMETFALPLQVCWENKYDDDHWT